jgi:hypothetical protein
MVWGLALMATTAACANASGTGLDGSSGTVCGDHICDSSEIGHCPQDCGNGPMCGNHTCELGETPQSCPQDCMTNANCGNGVCDTGETNATCPQDCPVPMCGNGVCDPGETNMSCPQDCTGGNLNCNDTTVQQSCFLCLFTGGTICTGVNPNDCQICLLQGFFGNCDGGLPDGVCEPDETHMTCPIDCP